MKSKKVSPKHLRRAAKADASRSRGRYIFSGSVIGGGMLRQKVRELTRK